MQELVYGTIRLRGRLDHLLDLHLRQGIGSLSEPLLRVLRLGAYQLLQMGSVPGYAAVSQTVDQARGVAGDGGARLANGVLRSLAREGGGEDRFPGFAEDPVGHLSTWGSHPRWLVARWVTRYGADLARQIVEAGNQVPPLYLAPVGMGEEEALRRLARAGIQGVPGPEGTGTIHLSPGSSPAEALAAVPSIVQDPAAAAVVEWVGDVAGKHVADLCAAPGGKGIGMAGRGAKLFAADPGRGRLRRMGEALDRLGLPKRLVVARGEAPPFREAEVVLVDVPCTGTGTLARHPDARWKLDPGAPALLARVQEGILEGAAKVVAPGGLLVYSTCTLEPEENEERVEAFLQAHREFIVEPGTSEFLRLLPEAGRWDGAFAARLRKRG